MTTTDHPDLAIVGGGAAGIAAAIFTAQLARQHQRPIRITLLDGAPRLGAKILVSGGGRCNLTNAQVTPQHYHASQPVIRNVLRAFDHHAAAMWFESLGVRLKQEDTGKLFPVTDSARTVLNAFLDEMHRLRIDIRTSHRVQRITPEPAGFRIQHNQGQLLASRLILATGGRSLPRTGSDGQGFALARSLGHTITPTAAALVPLVLDGTFFHHHLAGLSLHAQLRAVRQHKTLHTHQGSLLFTHFGVSGPLAMDMSRHWTLAHERNQPLDLHLALLPGESFDTIDTWLQSRGKSQPRQTIAHALATRLPRRLAETLPAHLGITPARRLAELAREPRRQLAHALTDLPLPILRHRGWNYAEVTAGGVPLTEVDHKTMHSRFCPGLHLVGEMLDCDGHIGGYNFQWAWSTAHLAAQHLATHHPQPLTHDPHP